MSDQFRFTILGCGSSGGVPRLPGLWGDCDPENPKNRRRRCSMLVERIGAEGTTQASLLSRFSYAFVQPEGSPYPPILDLHTLDGATEVTGPGGPITFHPFEVNHGAIDALGFRIGGLAYVPDVAEIPEAVWPMLDGLDIWVVDALRREPHPTHAHLAKTLEWIERAGPKRAVLTNMHFDLDYATVAAETPDHITPAYDLMQLTLDAE